MARELEITAVGAPLRSEFYDAIRDVRDGHLAWLTQDGERVCAMVPPDVAEAAEYAMNVLLTRPRIREDVQAELERLAENRRELDEDRHG